MWQLMSDYIGSLINVISVVVFAWLILRRKSKLPKWKIVLLIFVVSVILQVFCYFDITIFKTCITFILFAILFKYIYNLDTSRVIILDFFHFIASLLADISTYKIFSLIFGEEYFYGVIAGSLISNIVVAVIMIIITLIFRKAVNKFLNTKIKYLMIVALLVSLVFIIGMFYATFKLGTNSADKLLCMFSILAIIFVVSYSFVQIYNNNQLMLKYDNLLTFIKKYEAEIDNQRMMRHETKNQLLTIKSKIIDKEKPQDIVDYIDQLLNDDRKIKHTEYAKLKYLPSNGIKGLFYFKMITAQEKNITVNVNVSKNIENGFLSKLDANSFDQIGKILGVFLDNAIESAEISKDKILGIEAFTKNGEVIFIISNTFDPNVKKVGRTSKGAGHGYGLLLANNIISNNSKLSSNVEVVDNLYIEKLTIKE